MDNQTRTAAIKASIVKLGFDEAALTEIMYLAKARIRESQSQKREVSR